MSLTETLKPFLSARFIKFCLVGASGVVVNLGSLAFLSWLGLLSSLASAIAIELSIISNFVFNDRWTFRSQYESGSWLRRGARFQLVSMVGALIQWCVFIAGNVFVLQATHGDAALANYLGQAGSSFDRLAQLLVLEPPDIGYWILGSQCAGIAVATGWNFLANFHWTWRKKSIESSQ